MTLNLLFIFYTSIKMELTCNNHFQILKTEVIRLKKIAKLRFYTNSTYRMNHQKCIKFWTMSNIVGGGKGLIFFSPKMYEFQFENFKNTKGGSKFFENVYIKTITQTTFKISYLQIYLYLSLPKYIYFHFDLFK